jgi:predicted ATPase/transcriptional regulator with XRE-family HTH domain
MTVISADGQERAREHLRTARADIRRQRTDAMRAFGEVLRTWRAQSGVLQQDLAVEACVSPTVVRRIEKGDYESPPPHSLLAAVTRLGGPAREMQAFERTYQALQAEQRQLDQLIGRKVIPASVTRAVEEGRGFAPRAGLNPPQLPLPPPLFAGRDRELTALAGLLRRERLVSLVGPGGIGKTALALKFLAAHPGATAGPWFADLAVVAPGTDLAPLMEQLILSANDLDQLPADGFGRLCEVLGHSPALIVMDNCEHVMARAAAAARSILGQCPEARILATSREPLHLPDEAVLTIGPLPVDTADRPGYADGQTASADLFLALVERSRGSYTEARPGLSQRDRAAVADICRALEGVPLSLELAAARARTLSLTDIADSVRRSSSLLGGGRRDLPRHETIDASVAWSWDLLTGPEQRALSRLALLPGPVELSCAAAVAAADTETGQQLVAELADKSLLSPAVSELGEPRPRMLEAVRSFAARRLTAADRTEAVTGLTTWILAANPDDHALEAPGEFERLDEQFAVIRAALELTGDRPDDQVRIVLSIWPYLVMRPLVAEGAQWLTRALGRATGLSNLERGRALGALSMMRHGLGDRIGGLEAAEQSVAVRRELGDRQQLLYGLNHLVSATYLLGRLDEAARYLDEAYGLIDEADVLIDEANDGIRGDLWVQRALIEAFQGKAAEALPRLLTGIRYLEKAGSSSAFAIAHVHLSVVYNLAGEPRQAADSARLAQRLCAGRLGPIGEAFPALALAAAYLELEQDDEALATLDELPDTDLSIRKLSFNIQALRAMAAAARSPRAAASFLLDQIADFVTSAATAADYAMIMAAAAEHIAFRAGDTEQAARLLGVQLALWEKAPDVEAGPPLQNSRTRLRHSLPPDRLEALTRAGMSVPPGDAFGTATLVLREIANGRPQQQPAGSPPPAPA